VKIQGTASLRAPRERVWELLVTPELLARCLPGCEKLETIGPDHYKVALKIAVAAVSGKFSGSVQITERQPPGSLRMRVEGKGAPGFMSGDGLLSLSDAAGGTQVQYEGEAQVGGLIAAVGSRLLEATAKKVIQQFFSSADAELAKT
jgi:carbon monoxide dehydrogenase subunit G